MTPGFKGLLCGKGGRGEGRGAKEYNLGEWIFKGPIISSKLWKHPRVFLYLRNKNRWPWKLQEYNCTWHRWLPTKYAFLSFSKRVLILFQLLYIPYKAPWLRGKLTLPSAPEIYLNSSKSVTESSRIQPQAKQCMVLPWRKLLVWSKHMLQATRSSLFEMKFTSKWIHMRGNGNRTTLNRKNGNAETKSNRSVRFQLSAKIILWLNSQNKNQGRWQ